MVRKFSLYGLRLWAVEITFNTVSTITGAVSRSSTRLWITTKANSVSAADRKAKTFLRQHRDEYPKPIITGIVSHGFIDA